MANSITKLHQMAMIVGQVGLVSVVGMAVYAYLVGGDRRLVPLFYVAGALWLVGGLGVVLLRSFAIQRKLKQEMPVRTSGRRAVLWGAVVVLLLPGPWLFLMRFFGGPDQIRSWVAQAPVLLCMLVGGLLLAYHSYLWRTDVRQLQNTRREKTDDGPSVAP